MNQQLRKALCPDWCPKKSTDCNFECYDWEENGYYNKYDHKTRISSKQ